MCRSVAVSLGALAFFLPLARGAATSERWSRLLAAYAPAPIGYPSDRDSARPDTSAPFRWHFYHDGAIEWCEDARMRAYADPFNPLEGEGVEVERGSPVEFAFVPAHVTEGKQALPAE